MDYRIKRILIGITSVVGASMIYTQTYAHGLLPNADPATDNSPQKGASKQTVNDAQNLEKQAADLKQKIQQMEEQVALAKKKDQVTVDQFTALQQQAVKLHKQKEEQLAALKRRQEEIARQKAELLAEQKAKQLAEQKAALQQAQQVQKPPVQTVTRASGDDGEHHFRENDDD